VVIASPITTGATSIAARPHTGARVALTERSRSALYLGLSNIVDEEAVQEMMSYFPARDVEEPVTKEFLRAEVSDLRAEMSDLKASLLRDMSSLRSELREEMSELRTELKDDMSQLRTELKDDMSQLRTEFKSDMSQLRTELKNDTSQLHTELTGEMSSMEHRLIERINRTQAWNFLAMIAFAGTIIAAVRI